MTISRRQPRGFTMVEMLFLLIMLGVFALAASKLFYVNITAARKTAEAQNAIASFEAGLSAMRADVWNAREIAEPGSNVIEVTTPKLTVMWTIEGDQLVRQEDTGDVRKWTAPPGLTIAAAKSRVVVRSPAGRESRGGEAWLASRNLLTKEMSR
jgi:type II secretory pathway pseudopilin PulG